MKIFLKLVLFQFIVITYQNQLEQLKCNQPLVTLFIYSSQINPTWKINSTKFNYLKDQFINNEQIYNKSSNRIMGYQGFSISCSIDNQIFIYGMIHLEKQLLNTGISFLSQDIIDHVNQYLGQTISINYIQNRILVNNNNCLNVPIKGPDSVPHYNPFTDNGGCFITKQSKNNCYAYGVDIVTNTYPQPGKIHLDLEINVKSLSKGRYSGKAPSSISCESVRIASIRDGLIYKGTTFPQDQPRIGHYLALFIWPNVDYHWIRKDSNGYWSHKPGPGQVTNRDNQGLLISNPLKSNFTPWRIFCAFYIAQPSKIHIH